MLQRKQMSGDTYNLKNCFGFDEEDIDLSFWSNDSVINSSMQIPNEFQTGKPYRLALYVKPSERRKKPITNAFTILKNANQNSSTNKKNNNMLKRKNTVQTKSKKNKKVNVMLFDENHAPQNEIKRSQNTPERSKTDISVILKSLNSTRNNVMTDTSTKPITKSKQYKVRKSYERKCKEKSCERIMKKSSDEIIKELEIKKLSRTKPKKANKEEEEFEKWASDINSDFNDVDKFELSIAYD